MLGVVYVSSQPSLVVGLSERAEFGGLPPETLAYRVSPVQVPAAPFLIQLPANARTVFTLGTGGWCLLLQRPAAVAAN